MFSVLVWLAFLASHRSLFFALASVQDHYPSPGSGPVSQPFTPEKWIASNATAYMRVWSDAYNGQMDKLQLESRVDLPSFLHRQWTVPGSESELYMNCDLDEDCLPPPFDHIEGKDNEVEKPRERHLWTRC